MQKKKILFVILVLLCLLFNGVNAQTVKDIDGNSYLITTIGTQVWMAENLKTTKFNDGTTIPLVTDKIAWTALKTPGYCWFGNEVESKEVYGALYNWYATNTKKLCPKGWHVPADSEWTILMTFLGDPNTIGNKLREEGNAHWENSLGTNDFGFTALPGGLRQNTGVFPIFGHSYAVWWTATEYNVIQAWNRGLHFSSSKAFKGFDFKASGFSVRCIRDQTK